MNTATQEAPIPQDVLDEIAALTEEVKRLDPQIESLARRVRSVSDRLHEFPIMTGEHTDEEWNFELDEEIGDSDLRIRTAVLMQRLLGAVDPLYHGGLERARELGLDGFGLEQETR